MKDGDKDRLETLLMITKHRNDLKKFTEALEAAIAELYPEEEESPEEESEE